MRKKDKTPSMPPTPPPSIPLTETQVEIFAGLETGIQLVNAQLQLATLRLELYAREVLASHGADVTKYSYNPKTKAFDPRQT